MSSHIVLLHGLGRTALSMSPVAREAAKQGYSVLNLGYPSRTARVADLAEHVAHAVQQFAPNAPALDFVTHSLGGILLRRPSVRASSRSSVSGGPCSSHLPTREARRPIS